MDAKLNERTLQMMENFIPLRNENHSIKEIAEMFHLSPYTVYAHLDEIAQKAGVSRESLLYRVIDADHSGPRKNTREIKPIDRKQFDQSCEDAIENISKIREQLKGIIEDSEITLELLKEE